ncbi:hypothetical protein PIB30_053248 [Stylosanthes scabra]|uniref:Uncharacterized protein n=1 Tax=Stylosanthes scabra TaxID=79078 RepID=A0ABU6YH10_9FABA|nr:hypothetical protein [Stylosanthes scabra]
MRFSCFIELTGDGILTMIIESTKGTFLPPVLAEGSRDRLVALVIPQAGNLRFSPPSSHLTQDLFSLSSLFSRYEADRSFLPSSCCIPELVCFFGICQECSPRALMIPTYAFAAYGPCSCPWSGVPSAAYTDVRRQALP